MAKKLAHNEISIEIGKFTTATKEIFGNHAYAAGALQSQLAFVLSTIPAHKQQETLAILQQLVKMNTK